MQILSDFMQHTADQTHTAHSMKLRKGRCLRDIKKCSFPQRCVKVWNELSEEMITAEYAQFQGKAGQV